MLLELMSNKCRHYKLNNNTTKKKLIRSATSVHFFAPKNFQASELKDFLINFKYTNL